MLSVVWVAFRCCELSFFVSDAIVSILRRYSNFGELFKNYKLIAFIRDGKTIGNAVEALS